MNSIDKIAKATVMVASLTICPQVSSAEGFTGEVFFRWSEAEQRAYLDTQLVMASSIVARHKPEQSDCIASHFYGDTGLTDKGFEELIVAISNYETYHPSSVLVVMIENACGTFY